MPDSPPSLDDKDRALLDRLQEAVPVVARPFAEVGRACQLTEQDVLTRLRRLKEQRVIRQISAIFDTRSLGYASSLVAAKVAPGDLEQAVAVINSHPGVSHNYLRNHEFNVWYTIAVAPTSTLGLEATVNHLHHTSGARSTRLLPTLKLFKIGVRFDLGTPKSATRPLRAGYSDSRRQTPAVLTSAEISFVRAMQCDLALVANPFERIAENLGVTLAKLKETHDDFLSSGRMRRFAAVLHHRKAGFSANAMGVWAAPQDDETIVRLGSVMAGFEAVSHCYRRPTYPDWPYNLFTMVHGRSKQDCEETLTTIAEATGLDERLALYSSREFKKVRVRYFTEEERIWGGGPIPESRVPRLRGGLKSPSLSEPASRGPPGVDFAYSRKLSAYPLNRKLLRNRKTTCAIFSGGLLSLPWAGRESARRTIHSSHEHSAPSRSCPPPNDSCAGSDPPSSLARGCPRFQETLLQPRHSADSFRQVL